MKIKVLVGQVYGRLTVLRRVENAKSGRPKFECRCVCGTIKSIRGECLRNGNSKSCGCWQREQSSQWAPLMSLVFRQKPPGEAACRAAFSVARHTCAAGRGLAWEIPFETWKILSKLPCRYCGAPPSNLSKGGYGRNGDYHYNGLDRVDNDIGYTTENVVPCCKVCNRAKGDMPEADFSEWIKRVYKAYCET